MSGSVQNITLNDWTNLAKYATGATINHTDAPPMGAVGALAGFQGGAWLLANRKDLKGGFQNMAKETAENKKIMKSSKNIFEGTKKLAAKEELINFEKKLPKTDAYKAIRAEAQKAIKTGDFSKLKMLEEQKAIADYNVTLAKQAAVPKTKVGKGVKAIKDKTGLSRLSLLNKQALAKNATYRTAAKFVKGGGGMAIISAAIEAPNVYQTYKTLGKKAGNRQLAKSAVNVAAETAGWVVGAKAGAALGAAIGSAVPVVGTAIGAVVGVACGLLGSWLFGKASRAIVGKDELEIAQEKQAEELALAAQNDPELQQELAVAVYEGLESEGEELSEDGKTAAESLAKYIEQGDFAGEETTSAAADETGSASAAKTEEKPSPITTDKGLQALYGLAGDKLYTSNPFMSGIFNPMAFNTMAFNPMMMNPFMNNQFMFNNSFANPFMTNYFNPFMINNSLVA